MRQLLPDDASLRVAPHAILVSGGYVSYSTADTQFKLHPVGYGHASLGLV